jgi:hypothetical protein
MKRLFTSKDYIAGLRPTEIEDGRKIELIYYKNGWDNMIVILEDGSYYSVNIDGRWDKRPNKESSLDVFIEDKTTEKETIKAIAL